MYVVVLLIIFHVCFIIAFLKCFLETYNRILFSYLQLEFVVICLVATTVPLDYLVGILVFGHNCLCSVCLKFGVCYLIFIFSILGVEYISVSILSMFLDLLLVFVRMCWVGFCFSSFSLVLEVDQFLLLIVSVSFFWLEVEGMFLICQLELVVHWV